MKHLHPLPCAEFSFPHCTLVGDSQNSTFPSPVISIFLLSFWSLNTNINAFISGAELCNPSLCTQGQEAELRAGTGHRAERSRARSEGTGAFCANICWKCHS